MLFFLRQNLAVWHSKDLLELWEKSGGVGVVCEFGFAVCPTHWLSCFYPYLGSQHHVDKALNLIGKKFKELNLTNIYAPPLPSLALPSLPMTSWVSMRLGDQILLPSFHPSLPQIRNSRLWAHKAKSSLTSLTCHLWPPLVSSVMLLFFYF